MEDQQNPWGNAKSPMFVPAELVLSGNSSDTFSVSPQTPERFIVSIASQTGVQVRVYSGPNSGGRYVTLFGGGHIEMPADEGAVSFRNMTANTANIEIIALRGYSFVNLSAGAVV